MVVATSSSSSSGDWVGAAIDSFSSRFGSSSSSSSSSDSISNTGGGSNAGPSTTASSAMVEQLSSAVAGSRPTGCRTAIERHRLKTAAGNFTVADARAPGGFDTSTMTKEDMSKYVMSLLRFVPVEVATRYYNEPLVGPNGEKAYVNCSSDSLQHLGDQGYAQDFNAAVLFSDISGFTKLTNRLLKEHGNEGAEILNSIINRFFEELINMVTRFSGDVIKFGGDAIMSIWSSNTCGESLETLTHRAVACGLEQLQQLNNWDTKEGVMLQLHLGLGAGAVQGVDLGNFLRREFVVAGHALRQLSDAEQQAETGQLCVSPEAWALVQPHCVGTAVPNVKTGNFGPGFKIITKCHRQPPLPPHWRAVLEEQLKSSPVVPEEALRSFYVYAPGPLRPHLVTGKLQAASQFREVTMMFCRIGGLHYSDGDFVERFQRVVYLILSAVYVYKGSLSRVSIDDKGTCVKITFGLPPLYFSDDPARAIRCALLIRDQIRPMRLKANIGITTGTVFIGYVGSSSRGEYTEYGVMVNMAARFMGQAVNEVLVNQTTHDKALVTDKFDFDELPKVVMKGFEDPVIKFRVVDKIDSSYYEPDLRTEVTRGRTGGSSHCSSRSNLLHENALVGQQSLMHSCEQALRGFHKSRESFVVVLRGETGVGKTRLIEEIAASLCPQYDVMPIKTAAQRDEAPDYLSIWRQVLPQLPRLLGHVDAVEAVGRRCGGGRGSSTEQSQALKALRQVYRGWLLKPLAALRKERPWFTHSPFHSTRPPRGCKRSCNHSNGPIREEWPDAHDVAATISTFAATIVAATNISSGVDDDPTAAGFSRGLVSDAAVGGGGQPRLSATLVGIPHDGKERYGSDWQGQASAEMMEMEQLERFKKHEGLLNTIIDCGFTMSDETLSLSEESRHALTRHMLAHMLEAALGDLEAKLSKQALLIIEDAQAMDSVSWTLLAHVAEVIGNLAIFLTMGTGVSGMGGSMCVLGGACDLASSALGCATKYGGALGSTQGGSAMGEMPPEALKFLQLPRVVTHEVRPLDTRYVHELLCHCVGAQMVVDNVVHAVFQRTLGNPLYCIELATTMLQQQVITVHNDVCRLAIRPDQLETMVPISMHAAISNKIDHLSSQCAACIKAAAVMGMEFPAVVLAALGLDGVQTAAEREALLSTLLVTRLIEKVQLSNGWGRFLDGGVAGELLSGGVYRFQSSMLREVAYHSLPFEERRAKHFAIAKWIEKSISTVLEGDPDPRDRQWLYPMLSDHWLQITGADAAISAVSYLDRAAKAALEASMHREAIVLIKKELRVMRERLQASNTETQQALANAMLAEAHLAVGELPEAKEVIISALEVLDRPVEGSKELMRTRQRYELRWLRLPLVAKEWHRLYFRKPLDEGCALMVARLYENLGRTAYLLEEAELHDMAVLRCLNLSELLRRRQVAKSLGATIIGVHEALRPQTEQLARAYAAACIIERIAHDAPLAARFRARTNHLAGELDNPPSLTLYTNMMFGQSAMREADWKRAEAALRAAAVAADSAYSGRRGEEVSHELGLVLYMSGQLEEAHSVFADARKTCAARRDVPMLCLLTVGLCVPLLSFGRADEALELLHVMLDTMPKYMKNTSTSLNMLGLTAFAHARTEAPDFESARALAIEALASINLSTSFQFVSFWGLTAAIEALFGALATAAESAFDLTETRRLFHRQGTEQCVYTAPPPGPNQKLAFAVAMPGSDQFSFALLVESLEVFARFAKQHAAALPRQLLYEGRLRLLYGQKAEALDYFARARDEAGSRSMLYEVGLASLELYTLERHRAGLEKTATALAKMGAHVEATRARNALLKLPEGLRDGARTASMKLSLGQIV